MQPQTLLQTTGGPREIVVLALLGLMVTALISLVVAYVIVRGYWNNRDRGRLYLALGLVLLTTGPIGIQLVLTNVTAVSEVSRSAAANASKLCGLGAILYAIYGVSRNNESTSEDATNHSSQVRRR